MTDAAPAAPADPRPLASAAPVRAPGSRTRAGNTMGRTRAAVLEAAARCVAKYGSRRTTMGDVASAGGVAKATLYNHFRTKDDLYVALVDSEVRALGERGLRMLDGSAASLAAALAATAVEIGAHPALRRVAANEPLALARLLGPGTGGAWDTAREAVAQALQRSGLEPAPAAVEVVVRWLAGHVTWPPSHDHVGAGAEILVRGLTAASARAAGGGSAGLPSGAVTWDNGS